MHHKKVETGPSARSCSYAAPDETKKWRENMRVRHQQTLGEKIVVGISTLISGIALGGAVFLILYYTVLPHG